MLGDSSPQSSVYLSGEVRELVYRVPQVKSTIPGYHQQTGYMSNQLKYTIAIATYKKVRSPWWCCEVGWGI